MTVIPNNNNNYYYKNVAEYLHLESNNEIY